MAEFLETIETIRAEEASIGRLFNERSDGKGVRRLNRHRRNDPTYMAKLATDAVETAKIKDLNVTTGKLAAAGVTFAKAAMFVSTEQTGTGNPQNVAHGLAGTPAAVVIAVTEDPAGTGFDVAEGAHDGTNVVVTVTLNVKFKVWAML